MEPPQDANRSGAPPVRMTAPGVAALKGRRPIVALTAYDHPTARLLDEAGIDVALVGDSAANVVLGHDSTLPIGLDEMLVFARAVARGCPHALVVGDLPFGSYHVSDRQAVRSAIRFVKEAGVGAVKLEGGSERASAVAAIVAAGIPVMGHVGLRPQALLAMGGYRVQGRGENAAQVVEDARAIAAAGAFSIVIEGVPGEVGKQITAELAIPTIGIGAGVECDGQILVVHDLLGYGSARAPKFVRRYADLTTIVREALAHYRADVLARRFPGPAETY
jgi:3-methyl-2-oxobutanoate hydroxymethyltransferase